MVMTRQIAFLTLLIVSTLYAAWRGGTPERIGAAALLGAACLSVGLVDPFGDRFHHIEIAILLVDFALLSVFIWLSLQSTRFWPLWVTAMLGAEVSFPHLWREERIVPPPLGRIPQRQPHDADPRDRAGTTSLVQASMDHGISDCN
ncbi:hypothetical protein [Sphingobium sp. RAC03]|uniref:hypothetical protein n=1 Tax=Sphingobium sp. RAC03 TaxID=1843368 RepID=UPI00083E1069|nr:hypothetical protein [Sphingobium sp. RAC03]